MNVRISSARATSVAAAKTYQLLVPSERRKWSDAVLEIFTYGTINFALWFWALDWSLSVLLAKPLVSRLVIFVILLVSPIALGIAANAILRWDKLRRWIRHPTPTGWDHFFRKGEPCWILFRLKGSELVRGH